MLMLLQDKKPLQRISTITIVLLLPMQMENIHLRNCHQEPIELYLQIIPEHQFHLQITL